MKLFLLLLYLIIVSDRNSNKYQQIRQLLFQNMTAYLHKNSLLLHIYLFHSILKITLCALPKEIQCWNEINRQETPGCTVLLKNCSQFFINRYVVCEVGVGGIELHCLSDQAKKTMWFNIGVEGYVYGLNLTHYQHQFKSHKLYNNF